MYRGCIRWRTFASRRLETLDPNGLLTLSNPPTTAELTALLQPADRRVHLHQGLQKLAEANRVESIYPVLKFLLDRQTKLDPRDFSVGISACARATLWEKASLLFAQMQQGHSYPNVFAYNSIISAYEKSGHWQHALHLFRRMSFMQVFPTVVSYNSMITACAKGGEWQRALHFFQSMRQQKLSPNVVSFSAAMSAFENLWQEALSLFPTMLAARVTPDVVSYNTLISSCEKGKAWEKAIELFQHMIVSKLRPNLVSCNTIISSCHKGWQWQQALGTFQKMLDWKLLPNLVTYSSLISSLETHGEWELAVHFLNMCNANSKMSPDVIIYNATISSCAAMGEWRAALDLFHDMNKRNISPTVVSYTATINSLGARSEWGKALHLYQQMQYEGHVPNFILISSMLAALGGQDSREIAFIMFKSALRNGILDDLVSSGHQKLDLHGYSAGASEFAVRWWLEMKVAPILQGLTKARNSSDQILLQISLVTGFGSSLQDLGYTPVLRPFLLQILKEMGLVAQVTSNQGRIQVDLRSKDLATLLDCFSKEGKTGKTNGRIQLEEWESFWDDNILCKDMKITQCGGFRGIPVVRDPFNRHFELRTKNCALIYDSMISRGKKNKVD